MPLGTGAYGHMFSSLETIFGNLLACDLGAYGIRNPVNIVYSECEAVSEVLLVQFRSFLSQCKPQVRRKASFGISCNE